MASSSFNYTPEQCDFRRRDIHGFYVHLTGSETIYHQHSEGRLEKVPSHAHYPAHQSELATWGNGHTLAFPLPNYSCLLTHPCRETTVRPRMLTLFISICCCFLLKCLQGQFRAGEKSLESADPSFLNAYGYQLYIQRKFLNCRTTTINAVIQSANSQKEKIVF